MFLKQHRHVKNNNTNKEKEAIALQANWEVLLHYGDANIAILYQNIYFWCKKHEADEDPKYFNGGKYWMFYSASKMQKKLFPFWHEKKIQRMLKQLETDGFLVSSNFNMLKADKTKWYSTTNEI